MSRSLTLACALWCVALGCDDAETTDAPIADATIADATIADATSDATIADMALDAANVDMSIPVDGGQTSCDNALGSPFTDLVEIKWDDGQGVADISTQDWSVVDIPLATATLNEAVRFDLEHPVRIHGFAIQYGALPEGADTPLTAGLYPDFGYNGFDFWAPDPLWEGQRCRGEIEPGEWVQYTLDQPVEISQPGLVYVAHQRGEGDPAWRFDDSAAEDCDAFEACHSSWNLPELTDFVWDGQRNVQFNGLSLQFSRDYMVRLYVEYLDDLTPAERIFQPVEGVTPSNRMAWGDYDNDGDDDLFSAGPRLWRNDGAEGFVEVTEAAGLSGMNGSGVFGDYDNDGCLDVLLFDESYTRSERLLRNDCAGAFIDVTERSGLDDAQVYNPCGDTADRTPTPAAAWFDADNDGLLDIYLANFICWSDYSFFNDTIWHNEGNGQFSDWTGTHGFRGYGQVAMPSRGVSPIDYDQDGDVDVFVNRYTLKANQFYVNDGDGEFSNRSSSSGLAGELVSGYYGHSIGAAWGDLDRDGDFDLVVANLAHPRFYDFSDKTQVLIQNSRGRFDDIQGDFSFPAGDAGLRYQETHSVPALADFDQDGTLDLVISAVYPGRPTDFYWGDGDGTFTLDAYHAGISVTNGWGMATADIDLDGDLDLAASGVLFRNEAVDAGHWLQVRAVGDVASNRAALGATVKLIVEGHDPIRFVNGGTGQGCQDSLYLHFGLGEIDTIERVEVRFPGGGLVTYEGPFEADQRLWLYESGAALSGWVHAP